MNCLFCKHPSNSSISVEHILPESLGNKDHLLPRGIVCDNCNNYFASKIEKVVLDKPYFKNVRSRNFILTKKGRIVPEKILFPYKNGGWVNTWMDDKGFIFDTDNNTIIESIKEGRFNKLIIPIIDEPEQNDLDMSRFLAKVGLEWELNMLSILENLKLTCTKTGLKIIIIDRQLEDIVNTNFLNKF